METIVRNVKGFAGLAQKSGPYLLLEILLPGGTLFALLLFLYRNRASRDGGVPRLVEQAITKARGAVMLVQPYDITAVANSAAANDADGLGPLAMVPGR